MDTKRVLIMERTSETTNILKRSFPCWNVETTHADGLSNALEVAQEERYDGILVDLDILLNSPPDVSQVVARLPKEATVLVMVDRFASENDLATVRLHRQPFLKKPVVASTVSKMLERPMNDQTIVRESDSSMREIRCLCETLRAYSTTVETLTQQLAELAQNMSNGLAGDKNARILEDNASLELDFNSVKAFIASLVEELRQDGVAKRDEAQLAALEYWSKGGRLNGANGTLSSRELGILSMIESGMTTEEIADQLYISPDTVKTHRRNIRKKLDIVGAKDDLASYLQTLQKKQSHSVDSHKLSDVVGNPHDRTHAGLWKRFDLDRRREVRRTMQSK